MAVRSFGCVIGFQQNYSFFDSLIIKKPPHEIKGLGAVLSKVFLKAACEDGYEWHAMPNPHKYAKKQGSKSSWFLLKGAIQSIYEPKG
jgi:hypothetical protein